MEEHSRMNGRNFIIEGEKLPNDEGRFMNKTKKIREWT
jgi:hypothetical protein